MTQKILIILLIALVAIAAVVFISGKPQREGITKQQLLQKFQNLKTQYEQAKARGLDVSEVERLGKEAKQAFDKGDYKDAKELLDKATKVLEKTKSSWLNEGIIYETHPYYYTNHSFKEITKQIPSLADLGIKTIYLMPIWKHIEGEPTHSFVYLINDYYKIDPVYGIPEELKELVDTAHKYNLKVIFDLVTCCTPEGSVIWENNWTLRIPLLELKKLKLEMSYITRKGNTFVYSSCKSEGVPTCELFGKVVDDTVILRNYPRIDFGPAVDRTNPKVIDYFKGVASYYVREYDIDGWRIDYPANNYNPNIFFEDHSSLELLRSVKKAITQVKPDAILVGEAPVIVPDLTANPILDEIFEASYNHIFLLKYKKIETSEQLINAVKDMKIWYNRTRIHTLETHSMPRINNKTPELNKPLMVLISTIPGIPMIQAGQEIGATNEYTQKPKVDWAIGDYELRNFYVSISKIRNSHPALKYGDKESISNVWKSGDNIYAYSREYENEKVIVAINFQNKEATSYLDLSFLSKGTVLYDELNNGEFSVDNPNNFKISVPAYGSRILIIKR